MTETCVRIYDDVVSKEWCKETIDYYEKLKKGYPKNDEQLDTDMNIHILQMLKQVRKVLKKYV